LSEKGGKIRQRSGEMNKIRLLITFLMGVVFFAVLLAQAQSDRQTQPGKIGQKAVTKIEPPSTTVPQRAPGIGSRQGYQMVTDVLDGVGGASESDSYGMPVSSGGQSSAIGLSQSGNYAARAGYVYAASIKRGDANGDGIVNVGDIVYLVSYLYKGGPEPTPEEAGDVNRDGIINVGDIVYLVSYLYKGGPPPAC
jgi:hypothetical protein